MCITFTHSFNLLKLNEKEYLLKFTNGKIDFAFVGLCIFFSISGYLIAKSAIVSPSFKNYLWKRFLRIQPMLILVCILSVFILGPFFTELSTKEYFNKFNTFAYFRNIMPLFGIQFDLPEVFKNNIAEAGVNGSMWTLIVEERLYLIVGLLFLLKEKRQNWFVYFVGLLNSVWLIHIFIFNYKLIEYLNGGHIFYALIFLNSSCLYLLNFDFKSRKTIIIAGSAFFLFLVQYFSLSQPIQVVLIPLIVISLANVKSITNNLGKYGDFTYGIYIFSFPIQQILVSLNLINNNPIKLFFFTLAIVTPMSVLSWHLLEKKILLLKNRIG
ncbi:MAG: acyltransferase [Ferruginibacter sp.]|nr:acyltransferase [Ferruginibacter sp.]